MKPHIARVFGVVGLIAGASSLGLAGCGMEAGTEGDQVATTSEALSFSNSIYDGQTSPATQCTVNGIRMHCCPSGRLMTGAHVDANIFRCTTLSAGVILGTFLDGPDGDSHVATQRQNMHACPLGSVMVGYHKDRNDLLCASLGLENPLFETVDTGTQDPAMPGHVCPPATGSPPFFNGEAMSGIRYDQNRYLCAN